MSSVNSREARRRKIKERSSDRLALITGRIHALPPSADSSPHSVDVSPREVKACTDGLPRDDHGGDSNDSEVNLSINNPESSFQIGQADNDCKDESPILQPNGDQEPSLSSHMSQEASHPSLHEEPQILELNNDPEPTSQEACHFIVHEKPQSLELNNDTEPTSQEASRPILHEEPNVSELNDDPEPSISSPASREVSHPVVHSDPPILELNNDPQPSLSSPVSREAPCPVLPADPPLSCLPDQLKYFSFSPSELRSAVDHTANARILCSVLVSVLVVLSYTGFPLVGGRIFRSVLMFRPLYLVLLTNITLVMAWMILTQPAAAKATSMNGEWRSLSGGDNDWVNKIGDNLELGFLLMKLMDAVVVDCSLYSAIVVCGTCLARLFT